MVIIKKPGKYRIAPRTAINEKGSYYRVCETEITEIDIKNRQILSKDFGWIDWDLPVIAENGKVRK